jgi:hypothetical protein
MVMFRGKRGYATEAGLDGTRLALLAAFNRAELEREIREASSSRQRHKSTRIEMVIAAVLFVLPLLTGGILFFDATRSLPQLGDPGRIAVSVVDEGDAEAPLDVDVTYSSPSTKGTGISIAVSDWSGEARKDLSVLIYFCGAIRENLQLREANTPGALVVRDADISQIEMDSLLGYRADCQYVVARGGSGMLRQVIVEGSSSYQSRADAAARVSLAYPGVSSILYPEKLHSITARPLADASKVRVGLTGSLGGLVPSLTQPQLPESGLLNWRGVVESARTLPGQYKVLGLFQERETVMQLQIFGAGLLSGIAGAALLWFIQLALALRVGQAPTQSSDTSYERKIERLG